MSAQNIWQSQWEMDMVNFTSRPSVIWQNASMPDLTRKHQDLAMRGLLVGVSLTRHTPFRWQWCKWDKAFADLEMNAVVFDDICSQHLLTEDSVLYWSAPRDITRDKLELLLEDQQLCEKHTLACLKLVGLSV